jgi:hypothetical protein
MKKRTQHHHHHHKIGKNAVTIHIVLVNKVAPSTSSLAAQVTPAWLARVAAACQKQLTQHASPYYGGGYIISSGASAPSGDSTFEVDWQLPQAPGAEAYHDWQDGMVIAFEALATCTTLGDVSTGISHEILEILGDPGCNQWADDGTGFEWARELCDATQGNSYDIDGIQVSNFLLPTFFESGAKGPYTYLGTTGADPVSAPFTTAPSGYQIRRSSGTGETQVFGQIKARRPALRIVSPVSRSFRRLQQARKAA